MFKREVGLEGLQFWDIVLGKNGPRGRFFKKEVGLVSERKVFIPRASTISLNGINLNERLTDISSQSG